MNERIFEVEQATIGMLEAVKGLPEFRKDDLCNSVSHGHCHTYTRFQLFDVIVGPSKKQKRSASGEITSSTNVAAIPPSIPLKFEADDPLELNVVAEVSSAATGESNHLVQGCDDDVDYDQEVINQISGEEGAEINVHIVAGVRVVMVSANEDPQSPTSPAVEGFVKVHRYLLDRQAYFQSPFHLTRLLVPVEQAKSLIHSNIFWTIEEEIQCFLYVYLTDNVYVLSDGDAIIELLGMPECVNEAVREIAFHLRHIPVSESMIYELKSQVQHATRIPLSYVDRIIGENGANVETIRRSSLASIIISPLTSDAVHIAIHGDSTSDLEAAERGMEKFIGEKGIFECVYRNALQLEYPSPEVGVEW